MQIEVKDKYTGKNIKEPGSEIPDPPKDASKLKKTAKRRRRFPLWPIIVAAAVVGIVIGVIIAINIFAGKSELIGTWVKAKDKWTYEFKEDGTGSYGLGFGTPRTFHYEDNKESVEITFDKKGDKRNFEYHLEDGKLIIKNQFGLKETYKKKE